MLYERRLEIRTRGLVHGPGLITSTSSWLGQAVHWKVAITSRESGETIWVRPFATLIEAQRVYLRLTGLEPWYRDREIKLPHPWHDDELSYYIATVVTFNATNNVASDWNAGGCIVPSGVTATDYLLLGGGAGGGKGAGSFRAGGGGAGGLRTALALAVTPSASLPVVIGTSGAGSTVADAKGGDGNNSTWNSLTSLKGGAGGATSSTGSNCPGNGGNGTYGSGGGAGVNTGGSTAPGGVGTPGQGFNGGLYPSVGSNPGGGGGSAGAGANGAGAGGNGGVGTSSSITGAALFYGGGGGGGNSGTGGSSVGGAGGVGAGNGSSASPANRGSGGGGGGTTAGNGGNGSDGVLILSFTGGGGGSTTFPNLAMMGM